MVERQHQQKFRTLVTELWKWTPLFRSPAQLVALREFFVEHHSKERVLESLASGFLSKFEYRTPAPWGQVENYPPLLSDLGRNKLRSVMKEQVLGGKMIGGPGWTISRVSSFFGGRP